MTAKSTDPRRRLNRKLIFDAVRRLRGRVFRQSEVDALDNAIDAAQRHISDTSRGERDTFPVQGDTNGPDSDTSALFPLDRVTCGPSVPYIRRTDRPHPRRISDAGIALIKRFEGCARLRRDGLVGAYPDPGTGGEPWTIGWGATGLDDQNGAGLGERIGPHTVWTQDQCDARLARDLERYAAEVALAIAGAPTTQGQFDALVSFHYNTGAIHKATLTKKHVAGDYDGAIAEFARWKHAGGRVLKGLVRRRAEEAKLYASR
ncbi:glycoside hydrolase [Erythrobacter sp. KY5]|uniref:lysozyme n=1 Tax=Erythrobacter sp. KY5 TaxID=2011159 RepID=UPI000DBF2D4A|nr:lysozyme [Erythrobacter sp. KY5]AWW73966.1 glycoside hydrolase [Erythrobacter sp. KY5]